uniref:Uncharacterized mitochondrial protein AtMg00810-like n=1 Tax=Nicotiana tabacum TaxID=4097 RepID=A0A1S3ZLS6_TOBAC|nr:PREDICTED: uncharacterized mitochondrial protein AtMg00810-like [Nicotiana tabacum]
MTDIAFEVHVLCQYMHSPKVSHIEATLRVLRYIKQALGLGLIIPTGDTEQLTTYCDSDRGTRVETRRSVTGYLVKFGKTLVSWKSKKKNTVSRSSAEYEFRSMTACAVEITRLVGLFI